MPSLLHRHRTEPGRMRTAYDMNVISLNSVFHGIRSTASSFASFHANVNLI
ncbi:hypothetical protein WN943_002429 [Citrus x changshan-huyou]